MVLLGGSYSSLSLLYDVSDPLHPRRLCTIANTSAHLLTGDTIEYLKPVSPDETDIVLHSLGTGNESVAGKFPFNATSGAWLPDQSVMAYARQASTDPSTGFGRMQVWLYSQHQSALLFTYSMGIGDCICRFGLPPQVLAFSPDGQFLVAGRLAGKGSDPLAVYRVSDRTRVATLDHGVSSAIWSRGGHRLFLTRFGSGPEYGEQAWTPEGGVVALAGAVQWVYLPSVSPDGNLVAYTASPTEPISQSQPRVYVYDLKAGTTRTLIDKLRTQVVFDKDGWVWYLDERACAYIDPCTGSTGPTGKVFAMNLSAGSEMEVSFAPGESPLIQQAAWIDAGSLAPGEFWPQS